MTFRIVAGWLVALISLACWAFARCWHRHPLALLPPTANTDGSRSPARWHCHDCGKSWPAEFDHTARPVQRFSGYDQSKAADAAKRQAELERRQTRSAVARSGFQSRKTRRPAEVVPIESARSK